MSRYDYTRVVFERLGDLAAEAQINNQNQQFTICLLAAAYSTVADSGHELGTRFENFDEFFIDQITGEILPVPQDVPSIFTEGVDVAFELEGIIETATDGKLLKVAWILQTLVLAHQYATLTAYGKICFGYNRRFLSNYAIDRGFYDPKRMRPIPRPC